MELIRKEKRDNKSLYYLDSLDSKEDIKSIINLLEEGEYVINSATIQFIYDHSTVLPPREYKSASELKTGLEELKEEGIEIRDIDRIIYNAQKENLIRQGAIRVQDRIVTCTAIKKKKEKEEEEK